MLITGTPSASASAIVLPKLSSSEGNTAKLASPHQRRELRRIQPRDEMHAPLELQLSHARLQARQLRPATRKHEMRGRSTRQQQRIQDRVHAFFAGDPPEVHSEAIG